MRMVDSLTRAANEAARLASSLASAAVSTVSAAAAGAAQQSQLPITWDLYGRPIYDTAKAAESKANSDAFVRAITEMKPDASDAGLPTPAGNYEGGLGFNAAGGAVVPGPRGKGVFGLAHGGETIFTPEQTRALGAGGGGGVGGDLVIHFALDGKSVMQTLRVPLQAAIAAGQVRVN
jgi:hypothetical protein